MKNRSYPDPGEVFETVFVVLLAAGIAVGVISAVVIGVRDDIRYRKASKQEWKKFEQFDAYIQTLPNYDDSIRLAKTQEELERALALREQQRLKIVHFRDSLWNVKQ